MAATDADAELLEHHVFDAAELAPQVAAPSNPENAAEGTIRKEFALSVGENSVHGSDAPETAAQEIKFFFSDDEIVG